MVIFAALTSPTIVGYYSAAILAYMVVQSTGDAAIRQIAVGALSSRDGLRFLSRYQRVYALTGMVFVAVVIAAMVRWGSATALIGWELAPIALAPVAVASGTRAVATLQRAGRWRQIGQIQGLGVLASCAVTIPLVIATRSPIGSALQLLVSEALFAWGARRAARRVEPVAVGDSSSPTGRLFASASLFTLLTWAQGQADRVCLGFLGGSHRLGLYTFGWNLSRNVTDSLGIATGNVLRPLIIDGTRKAPHHLRSLVTRSMRRGIAMTACVVALTYIGAYALAPLVFGPEWAPALEAVPLMSVSAVPALVSWCLTPVLVHEGMLRTGTVARVAGLALSFVVAACALKSLVWAAWAGLGREMVAVAIMAWGCRRVVGARLLLLPAAVMVGLALACGAGLALFPLVGWG
jgi:O-antigen/teichoic acid export membrane protein